MNVVFRVDGSYLIGSGHVMRCLVLADALKKLGCYVIFVTRDHDGHFGDTIFKRGFDIFFLETKESDRDHVTWLGVSQELDARQFLKTITSLSIDLLVVDHYDLDYTWESIVRTETETLFVIDDRANRRHNCDVLLDQNFRDYSVQPYHGLVAETCKQSLGPSFALLSEDYQQLRRCRAPLATDPSRLLVYFGGTDWQNMTARSLQVLSKPSFSHLSIDVVVGKNYPYLSELTQIAEERGYVEIYQDLPSIGELISKADIAIGGGGASMWERMCLGVPSIVVSLAENQVPACSA